MLVNGRIGVCINYIVNFTVDIKNLIYHNTDNLCYNLDICKNKNITCYFDKDNINLQSPELAFMYIITGITLFILLIVCTITIDIFCIFVYLCHVMIINIDLYQQFNN